MTSLSEVPFEAVTLPDETASQLMMIAVQLDFLSLACR